MDHSHPLRELRGRSSAKWTTYPADVLPMFVAETDFRLAPAIEEVLIHAIRTGDTGYAPQREVGAVRAAAAFAGFAADRWGWHPEPDLIGYVGDVSVAVVESMRRLIEPGDSVVISPPVYPPFFEWIPEVGGRVVEVPILDHPSSATQPGRARLDLDGIDRALAAGARCVLLCNPHNPLGLVHSRDTLRELSRIVADHGATVISDEIHGPLSHHDATFTPYLSVSAEARKHGIAAESGSKAFNLAGLKAAMLVAEPGPMADLIADLPEEITYRTGLLGLLATQAGFADSRPWLDTTIGLIEDNLTLLADELTRHLPGATFHRPEASYLAWLDLSELGWGDDPAQHALHRGRVALASGPAFGTGGSGHARINLGCAPETVIEAVTRLRNAC